MYRTRKFENYGKLSDQSIDELEVGASQRTGEEQQQKEDPLDFALWETKQNLARFSWGFTMGQRASRLAHRMFRHGDKTFRRNNRYPWWWARFGISSSRKWGNRTK